MRFNHLQPPLNNPAIRRALLGAIDQTAAMQAVAGENGVEWRDHIGLFGPAAPLSNDAGIDVLASPRDYAKARRDLAAAGYRGERVVVLDAADISVIHALSLIGADMLRRAGMEVDVQSIDFGSSVRRRQSRQSPDQGGWNVFCTFADGTCNFTPMGAGWVRGNGEWVGWPKSDRLEQLNQAWLDASDLPSEQRICRDLQLQVWQDVPYIPMGEYSQPTCFQRTLAGVPKGFPLFYGVRPA
jgi:peptide/nickel transport system substrate-binding protein